MKDRFFVPNLVKLQSFYEDSSQTNGKCAPYLTVEFLQPGYKEMYDCPHAIHFLVTEIICRRHISMFTTNPHESSQFYNKSI